jgi:type I restriction enzyme S subunit
MNLTTYDKYKDSGIEWLGDVPEHWRIRRVKQTLDFENYKRIPLSGSQREKMISNKYDYYGASGVIDKVDDYIFDETLILLGEDGANLLTRSKPLAFLAKGKYWVNNHAHVLKPKKGDDINFYTYLLETINYTIYITGSAQPKLNKENLANIKLICPPLQEQTQIANYLDQQTTKIDKKINLLTKKIKHYQDLKTALINKAVTKGLDDSVEMKDSGVEWIGEIPKHWEANALKRFYSNIGSGTTPASGNSIYYKNGIINWVVTGDLNNGLLKNNKYKITQKALDDFSTLKIYPKGTLLIAMYGATIGKTGILDFEACTNQACCALVQGKKVDNKFMFYWFLAQKKHIINLSVGGGQPNISQGIIKEIIVTIPPKQEQQKIVNYLNKKTNTIDKIIANLKTQIQQQKDLRKTLINDVVTGKLRIV